MKHINTPLALILLISACLQSCNDFSEETAPAAQQQRHGNESIDFASHSSVPPLVYAMDSDDNLAISTLISSPDVLVQTPSFVYGGQPDGAGLMKDPNNNGYLMITNHEINKSVSRVYLDETFKPVKGEYIVDGVGGMTRLCSATLATPDIHGFGPIFLTAGESGEESMVHGIDPLGPVSDKSRTDRVLPGLGKASMENAVPLPKNTYPGKTIILIGEDQSYSTSHASAGQLLMYKSDVVGDLTNGKLYALKRNDGNQIETNIEMNGVYDVSFVEIPNAANLTGASINTLVNSLGAIRFSRVEDVDYRKGPGGQSREIYFTATGQASGGAPVAGFTMWGRIYKLKLNANNPLAGKIEVVVDGGLTPGIGIINPDNICVTKNYVYIQEDGDSFYTASQHDSYIWQYDISKKESKPWINMKHDRTNAAWNAMYNQTGEMRKGSWEFGAMLDISDIIGVPDTFMINVHPHTWQNNAFLNADGSGTSTNKEGGQTVIVRNVPQ